MGASPGRQERRSGPGGGGREGGRAGSAHPPGSPRGEPRSPPGPPRPSPRRPGHRRGERGGAGGVLPSLTFYCRKRGRSSDVTGSPGPAPSPGRGRGHRGGFLAARWGRHGRRDGGPLLPRRRLLLLFFLLLLTGGTPGRRRRPGPCPAPRQGGHLSAATPGGLLKGGSPLGRARGSASPRRPPPPPLGALRGARRAPPWQGPAPGAPARPGAHTHTRTDTQRDGADAEIPEVPPRRPPGRASPRPRPPGLPRPGAAGETHRRAAHPAEATTFHPGRQPAAAASPSAAGSGRGRKYEEEARRALRRGAPFLARDAGFAGGGCAAALGFLHQLWGCVCVHSPHVCPCVCALSVPVTLPGRRARERWAALQKARGPRLGFGYWPRRGIWHFFLFFLVTQTPRQSSVGSFSLPLGFFVGFCF